MHVEGMSLEMESQAKVHYRSTVLEITLVAASLSPATHVLELKKH